MSKAYKTIEIIDNDCDLRYPVMLVHGTAMSDRRSPRCWGRIPELLARHGARVCFGRQDAWGSAEGNAAQLASSVDKALGLYGAEKINIIAHSKGGLDARALTAIPGNAQKIASITTISSPHKGIGWLSKIWKAASPFIAVAGVFVYPFFRLCYGDRRPRPHALAKLMTRGGCEKFNAATPDADGIFYQSYAGRLVDENKFKLLHLTRFAANRFDGDNDGMVAVESAKWGTFRGIIAGAGKRGLSHADEIDYFRRDYVGDGFLSDGENSYENMPQVYVRIAVDLKQRGY